MRRGVRFDNAQQALGRLSTVQLIRGLIALRLSRIKQLTLNTVPLLRSSEKIFGHTLTYHTFVKWIMYDHFCAGETENSVRHTLMALQRDNIFSILDYAAEADEDGSVTPAPGAPETPLLTMEQLVRATNVPYVMHRERGYDENMMRYLLSVVYGGLMRSTPGAVGFAAVKVTGMCDPQILARVSALLLEVRRAWIVFQQDNSAEGGALPPLMNCRVVVGVRVAANERFASHARVREGLRRLAAIAATNAAKPRPNAGGQESPTGLPEPTPLSEAELDALLKLLDPANTGRVDYLRFTNVVSRAMLGGPATSADSDEFEQDVSAAVPVLRLLPGLTAVERELWGNVVRRLTMLAQVASELGVRIMVDAEQSFYQMAIDHIVRDLQRAFNVPRKKGAAATPIVYNTYQCYLKHAATRVDNDLARSEAEGWVWAGKIVRGAYMVQERQTAGAHKYESPIHPTLEATAACYSAVADRLFDTIAAAPQRQLGICFGTHNQQALEYLTDRMAALPAGHASHIAFAQLLGMADHLTVPLAAAGLPTYKYVPYGPVRETIHYLARRAQENGEVLAQGPKVQAQYTWAVLKSRFRPW